MQILHILFNGACQIMKIFTQKILYSFLPLPFIFLLSTPTLLPASLNSYLTVGSFCLYFISNTVLCLLISKPDTPTVNLILKILVPPIALLTCYWLFSNPLWLISVPIVLVITNLPINSPYKIVVASTSVLACAYFSAATCVSQNLLLAVSCLSASGLGLGIVFVAFLHNSDFETKNFNAIINHTYYMKNHWPGILFCTIVGLSTGAISHFIALSAINTSAALTFSIVVFIATLVPTFILNPISLLTTQKWKKNGIILDALFSIILSAGIGFGFFFVSVTPLGNYLANILTLVLTLVATASTVYGNRLKFLHNYNDFDPLTEALKGVESKAQFNFEILKMIFFGDSLSDPGNYQNFALPTKKLYDIDQTDQVEFTNLFNWNEVLINQIISKRDGQELRREVGGKIIKLFHKDMSDSIKQKYTNYLTDYLINKAVHMTNASAVIEGAKDPSYPSANYAIGGATAINYFREWFWESKKTFGIDLIGYIKQVGKKLNSYHSSDKKNTFKFKSKREFTFQFLLKNLMAENILYEKSKFQIQADSTLAFIFAGANDLIAITSDPEEIMANAKSALYGIKMQMAELVKKGVDKFVLFELPDITKLPLYHFSENKEQKQALKSAAEHFTQEINNLASDYANSKQIHVTVMPVNKMFNIVLDSFDGTKPSSTATADQCMLKCDSEYKKSCTHPNGQYFNTKDYLCFDGVHPSYNFHQIIGLIAHAFLTSDKGGGYNFDNFANQLRQPEGELASPLLTQVNELASQIEKGGGEFFAEINRIVEFMKNHSNDDTKSFESPLFFLGVDFNSTDKILRKILMHEQRLNQENSSAKKLFSELSRVGRSYPKHPESQYTGEKNTPVMGGR